MDASPVEVFVGPRPLLSLAYLMITHTPLVAGINLVARQWPTDHNGMGYVVLHNTWGCTLKLCIYLVFSLVPNFLHAKK